MARVSLSSPGARGNATGSDLLQQKDATVRGNKHIVGQIAVSDLDDITPSNQAKIFPEAFYQGGFTVKASAAAPPDPSDGLTATSSDILYPKTAAVNGAVVTGNISSRTSGTVVVNGTLPAGYYPQPIPVQVPDPSAAGDATASDMLSGKKAAVNGSLVTGTIPVLNGVRSATGVAQWGDGGLAVYPERGYQKGGAGDGEIKVSQSQIITAEPDLSAGNIRSGVNLFGVVGSYVRPAEPNLVASNIKNGVSIYGVVGTLQEAQYYETTFAVASGAWTQNVNLPFVPTVLTVEVLVGGVYEPYGSFATNKEGTRTNNVFYPYANQSPSIAIRKQDGSGIGNAPIPAAVNVYGSGFAALNIRLVARR